MRAVGLCAAERLCRLRLVLPRRVSCDRGVGGRGRARRPPLSHQASRRRHPARLALPAGRHGSRSRCCDGLRRRSSGARCGRSRPGRRRGRGLRRGPGGGRLVAARLRPLVDVAHSTFEQLAHVHVGLGAFFGLVGHHRLWHVTPDQALERKVGALRTRACGGWSPSGTARCTGRSTCTWPCRCRMR